MKKEEEFFDKVEEVLHSYTETYEEGAWEDFVVQRKKDKRVWPFYKWVAAAAIVVLFVYGLFELTGTDQWKDTSLAKNGVAQKKLKLPVEKVNPAKTEEEQVAATPTIIKLQQREGSVLTDGLKKDVSLVVSVDKPISKEINELVIANSNPKDQQQSLLQTTTVNGADPLIVKEPFGTGSVITNGLAKQNTYPPENKVKVGAYDSLVNRNTKVASAKNEERGFTYSVVVSPSLSNQKVNFGAGMEISYRLGSRLSINSGLMYNELNAKSGGGSLSSSSRSSQDADLAVSGIEIPLGLQYTMNNGFYASAGISGMSLISNRLAYSYQEDRVASMPVMNSGVTEQVIVLVSEQKTAKSKEDLNNYMGFFTFSAGKKQAIGNSHLNIGPFVKIPFNSISAEKIKLLQGGFKVSFDF